jgi:signal transduction histidine kinase
VKSQATILVVDDDPINVSIMEEILGDQYRLAIATSGEEALESARASAPDLVLLDIMMPRMDGYETCRRMRSDSNLQFVKIILVSAKAMVSERLKGYQAGADDYITKPFDHQELLAKVRVFLRLKSAEEVIQLKNGILALLNHETNTPLTGIISPAELLLVPGAMEEDERRELGSMILANAGRLQSLFQKVVLLSGLRTGGSALEEAPVDLVTLVGIATAAVKESWRTKSVEIRVDAPQSLVVSGDEKYLRIVLESILENAARFSPEGGVVTVNLRQEDGFAFLSVTDHGRGLAPASAEQVFEELEPGDLMHHTEGQRLSLALSSAIVRRHGGELEVSSVPGVETTFKIRLSLISNSCLNVIHEVCSDIDDGVRIAEKPW